MIYEKGFKMYICVALNSTELYNNTQNVLMLYDSSLNHWVFGTVESYEPEIVGHSLWVCTV